MAGARFWPAIAFRLCLFAVRSKRGIPTGCFSHGVIRGSTVAPNRPPTTPDPDTNPNLTGTRTLILILILILTLALTSTLPLPLPLPLPATHGTWAAGPHRIAPLRRNDLRCSARGVKSIRYLEASMGFNPGVASRCHVVDCCMAYAILH